jgi:ATP-binding cassette subfamily F protein 3
MTPYAGTYEHFVAQRTERRLAQQRQFDKQGKVIAAQEDYIRRNLAGQNTKQAKGRRKLLARTPRLSPPPGEEDVMALRLEVAHRGGDQVLVADKATLAVKARAAPTARSSRTSPAASRAARWWASSGPTGAGKSTLLKAVVGEREPLVGGSLRVGDSILVAHYRQDMGQVPFGKTLYDVIQDLRPTWERRLVQGHLGRFGFSGDEVLRRADTLSGGERARVALAMMMLSRSNLLILDEPTNHLDVESIEALEDALEGFEGTVLLVSHDRAMLRALATQVWALHDGRVHVFEQPFDEWEAEGGEALLEKRGASAAAADAQEKARLEREERARARAAEEAERAREAEKQARAAGGDARRSAEREGRKAAREAERRVERAEREAQRLEAEVARLQAELDDAALYTAAGGVQQAKALSRQLEVARGQLERALEEWAAAGEAAEAVG